MPRRDTLAKRGPGRPSAFTPERANKIEAALRSGNHITTACAVAGTSTAAFYRWMQRAERADYAREHGQPYDRADDEYREFRDRVLAARAHAAETMVDVVMRAAIGGQLVEESPAVDSKGDPIRDEDGNVIMSRKWTTPDGRLALAYLKVAQPEGWSGAPGRLELSGPGGGPIPVGDNGDGEPDGDAVSRLASRVAKAIAQQEEHKALAAAHEPGSVLRPESAVEEPVYDAELVEDDDA